MRGCSAADAARPHEEAPTEGSKKAAAARRNLSFAAHGMRSVDKDAVNLLDDFVRDGHGGEARDGGGGGVRDREADLRAVCAAAGRYLSGGAVAGGAGAGEGRLLARAEDGKQDIADRRGDGDWVCGVAYVDGEQRAEHFYVQPGGEADGVGDVSVYGVRAANQWAGVCVRRDLHGRETVHVAVGGYLHRGVHGVLVFVLCKSQRDAFAVRVDRAEYHDGFEGVAAGVGVLYEMVARTKTKVSAEGGREWGRVGGFH